MLRAYFNPHQDDWDLHLPMVEFCLNASQQASTGFSPFKLVCGCEPLTPAVLVSEGHVETKSAEALDMVEELQKDLGVAKENIRKAQQQQAKYYNKRIQDLQFNVGVMVYINSAHLKAHLPADTKMQLQRRWLGSFPMLILLSHLLAYRITLPARFEIHPAYEPASYSSVSRTWSTNTMPNMPLCRNQAAASGSQ